MGVQTEVIQISGFFLLLFTSSASFGTIQTQLFEQLDIPWLGLLSLLTTYAAFMGCCLIAPFFGKRINYKKMLVVAALGEMFSYTSLLFLHHSGYSALSIIVFEAVTLLDGLTSSFMWVAQAGYIHYTCEANGMHHRKGYFYGLFFAIYSVCNITSGLVSTFMLGFFDVDVYFYLLEGLSIITVLYCWFVVTDVQAKYKKPIGQEGSVLLTDGEQPTKPQKLWPAIKRVFKFYGKMVPLLSSIGLVGISIAFYSSSLHKILYMALPENSDNNYVNLRTGIMFLVLGCGEIAGGYLGGWLNDKISVQKVGAIALAGYMTAVIFSLIGVNFPETVVPVMIAAFLWGFQEAYIQNWITVVCSRIYQGALQAFIINKQFHCVTLVLYELMLLIWSPSMDVILPLILIMCVPCLISVPFIKEELRSKQASIHAKEPIEPASEVMAD